MFATDHVNDHDNATRHMLTLKCALCHVPAQVANSNRVAVTDSYLIVERVWSKAIKIEQCIGNAQQQHAAFPEASLDGRQWLDR